MAGVIRDKENPVVFFELQANKQKVGRLTFELYQDLCPKAAQNFRQFCTGQYLWKGKPAGYKETCLHKVVEDKFIEGGDFIGNGVQSKPKVTIWGEDSLFADESFELKHEEGSLSLVNAGVKDSNGNLFRIGVGESPELNGKSVVFGKVIDESSLKVLRSVVGMQVGLHYRPKYPIVIRECGEM